ncbi:MAG: PxxKW family cysteine-rich protein [Desulfobulbaceae bacterium]|nr:PxxKW family cysteine-rich protein [Desulfobulbaceae bacterium]HIJ79310.1 hypothetical protein [Deltaproteobacteria bacterium]
MAKAAAQDNTLAKYTNGSFKPVIDKCEGCERIIDVESAKYCKAYSLPEAKWRLGICNFATHAKPEIVVATIKVNPLKASKRASGKKKK